MRGKTWRRRGEPGSGERFNEAPAECGGKLVGGGVRRCGVYAASMRPPQNAGENSFSQISGMQLAFLLQ